MFILKNKRIAYVAVFLVSLLAVSLLTPFLRRPLIDTLKTPFSVLALARREVEGLIFYHRNYIQNEKLRNEAGLLMQRLNLAQEAESENARLRKLLGIKEQSSYGVIAARVIARPADNWSSALIIDKGRKSGIRRGMAVLSYQGLAGRIVDAGEETSRVMLVNDPNLAVSALVKRSRQEGLVTGTLGNLLIMRYLPKTCDIQPADTIITSGLTDAFPKGLLIGTVTEVGEEFSGLSRYAVIRPVAEPSSIEEVLVIVK